jgi:hypothetical protein
MPKAAQKSKPVPPEFKTDANKPRAAREHEPVTIERLERALAVLAYLVVLDGPVVIPLFERMERELAAMRAQQATVERAKRLLESYAPPGT